MQQVGECDEASSGEFKTTNKTTTMTTTTMTTTTTTTTATTRTEGRNPERRAVEHWAVELSLICVANKNSYGRRRRRTSIQLATPASPLFRHLLSLFAVRPSVRSSAGRLQSQRSAVKCRYWRRVRRTPWVGRSVGPTQFIWLGTNRVHFTGCSYSKLG